MKIELIWFIAMLTQLRSYRLGVNYSLRRNFRKFLSSTPQYVEAPSLWTNDVLVSGLNRIQDISVRVVSCKDVLQRCINNGNLSDQHGTALGELLVCGSTLSSTLKGEETSQFNVVSGNGKDSMTMICDGSLNIRARVSSTSSGSNFTNNDSIYNLFEAGGQIQNVRFHPVWKSPVTGITALRDSSLAVNMALHSAESEQRTAALLTTVKVVNGSVEHAVGVLVERMPPVVSEDGSESGDENLEMVIANLETIERRGLRHYFTKATPSVDSKGVKCPVVPDFFMQDKLKVDICPDVSHSLHHIMDEIFRNPVSGQIEECGMRWFKNPTFKCTCGVDKAWQSVSMLGSADWEDIAKEGKDVEVSCQFCGSKYCVSARDVESKLLNR